MPYRKLPEFKSPDSSQVKLWRFMDLPKFLSILDKKALYFSRLDQLSEFDPFEGYLPLQNIELEKITFDKLSAEWKESTGIKNERHFDDWKKGLRTIRYLVKYHRKVTFVSSWYLKEQESAAMWKLYSSNSAGIAIQSTFQNFVDSFEAYVDFDIYVGQIQYIDFEKETIPVGSLIAPFLYKRKNYEHEDELRAMIWTPHKGEVSITNPLENKYKDDLGIYVPVNLDVLIDRIIVGPNAPPWIVELIKSLSEKFDLMKEIIQSDLASIPSY